MEGLNNKLNECQFITEGWLEDIYDEINNIETLENIYKQE